MGSALGCVVCPAFAPSRAPPLSRGTHYTPYALTLASAWLAPTVRDTLPLAHPLALTTPSGLQPLGESGSAHKGAVVFLGYAFTTHAPIKGPQAITHRALLSCWVSLIASYWATPNTMGANSSPWRAAVWVIAYQRTL